MNIEDIFKLIDKVDNSSVTEVSVKENGAEIKIKKESFFHHEPAERHVKPAHNYIATGMASDIQGAPGEASPEPKSSPENEVIKSPLVGTFYRSPAPDAPAFVEAGKMVKTGQTLCILEAMKVMNELTSDFDCEIVNILVENGSLVEYGTPLFEIKK